MKMDKRTKNKKEEGFMVIEAMVLLFAFVLFAKYLIDFFTAIHMGIMNQTAARAYAFETFQHRPILARMRNEQRSSDTFDRAGYRYHGITSEKTTSIAQMIATDTVIRGAKDEDSDNEQTSQILLKTGYGMCVSKGCK